MKNKHSGLAQVSKVRANIWFTSAVTLIVISIILVIIAATHPGGFSIAGFTLQRQQSEAMCYSPDGYPCGPGSLLVGEPVFNPVGGNFTSSQSVQIITTTPGATIRYTTDGTEPTANSALYTLPFNISATTTVKAKAFKASWIPSDTVTTQFTRTSLISPNGQATIDDSQPAIVIKPVIASIKRWFTLRIVTLSTATPGATIRYTTNGAEPTANSSLYNSSIVVKISTILKAKAFKTGLTPSETAVFRFNTQ